MRANKQYNQVNETIGACMYKNSLNNTCHLNSVCAVQRLGLKLLGLKLLLPGHTCTALGQAAFVCKYNRQQKLIII